MQHFPSLDNQNIAFHYSFKPQLRGVARLKDSAGTRVAAVLGWLPGPRKTFPGGHLLGLTHELGNRSWGGLTTDARVLRT